MTTIKGVVHSWDRRRHRGIAQLDDDRTVQIIAADLGAAQRRPEWMGPFRMYISDRAEFVLNDDNNVVDVLRVW
jgi:hypothetical protein